MAADVQEDRRVNCKDLASAHGISNGTMHNILRDDLGLVKKSARWVPKSSARSRSRSQCGPAGTSSPPSSATMLQNIVTMDETIVSYHTPETKKQSRQWIEKGKPGPIKAGVHASRTKQMVMAFFDCKGLIYTHIVPGGDKVNAIYIVKVLGTFMKHLRKKRPEMVSQDWFFHWDNDGYVEKS